MKKILLALTCCVLPLMAEDHKSDATPVAEHHDAAAKTKPAKKAKKAPMTLETRGDALKAAIAEHKEPKDLFDALNAKKMPGETKANYIVCYTKDGDKFTANVHPKKEIRGTEVAKKEILDLLPVFFDNADKGVYEYEYDGKKKKAMIFKVGSDEGKQICAVTEAVKAEKKAHKAEQKKDDMKKDENKAEEKKD